ncbi:LysR family transcriptional regulator [Niveibacterium sp. SC-1]|uniref:LysR family transcriptional regulator n=1 Tax=Niveibacterium sp. SC-1 TaxID=3135646 RepID=UPI00311E2396
MLDWDDLRFFVVVVDAGSTLAAARTLGVSQSTVQRRLAALETHAGQPMMERQASGYALTPFGEAMLPHARRVAAAVAELEEQLGVARRTVSGVLRLTCPEPLASRLRQSGLLERFQARHPALRVEFVMSDKYLDLARGDADVAFRSGDTDDGALVGRKIADSFWAVYASRAYVERCGGVKGPEALAEHELIGFDDSMDKHRAAQWLREVAPGARIVARNDSVLGVLHAARAGLGVAALPTAIADAEPELVRLFGPVPALTRIWRILTTQALRKTPPVAAFFDFVADEADAVRALLNG